MILKYVCHDDSDKSTYLKVRNIVQQQMFSTEGISEVWGSNGNELDDCRRGIQYDLDHHPRINAGFLNTFFKVEQTKDSVQVFHVTNSRPKRLICEIIKVPKGEEK